MTPFVEISADKITPLEVILVIDAHIQVDTLGTEDRDPINALGTDAQTDGATM